MSEPLAESMRPGSMADFVGQPQLRNKINALLNSGKPRSILLYGPPGCGKSTLALLFAKAPGRKFMRLSAPEAGLAQLRRAIAGVDILVLDELHRFSKAQQDFFLPLLENGDLVLIATTTENPSFSVTRQLLSRMLVLRLQPLDNEDMVEIGRRGMDSLGIKLDGDTLDFLASSSGGDARTFLNLLEYVAALPQEQRDAASLAKILPETLPRHDKKGDSHYELASALIKSIRGSDVDAAIYYLACLLEGGEDPRFICRRLILSAAEDVGLADPAALPMAVACQQAVEFTGMPEGFIPLAETVVYLAMAKKSNSTYAAYLAAAREIKRNGRKPVPFHLRNATTGMQKSWGYGRDYLYPHNYPDSWVRQAYLPEELEGKNFYQPRGNGREPELASWWLKLQNFSSGENEQ